MPSSHLILCRLLLLLPPMSQLFAWGGQSTRVSALASLLPKKSQGWSSLKWTGWTSSHSKGLSRVFSNTTVQKLDNFCISLFYICFLLLCLLFLNTSNFRIHYVWYFPFISSFLKRVYNKSMFFNHLFLYSFNSIFFLFQIEIWFQLIMLWNKIEQFLFFCRWESA